MYKDPLDSIPQFRAQRELKSHSYDSSNIREENNSPGDPLSFIFDILSTVGLVSDFARIQTYKKQRIDFNPEDSLLFDDAGKRLIRHFLTGNGDDFIINNEPYWNFYLGDSIRIRDEIGKSFDKQLEKELIRCNGIYPDKVYFKDKKQIEVTNDGGGFTISGVGIKRSGSTYLISYRAFLEDVFDFNMSHGMDSIKSKLARFYDFIDTKIEMNVFNIEINFKGAFMHQTLVN